MFDNLKSIIFNTICLEGKQTNRESVYFQGDDTVIDAEFKRLMLVNRGLIT